MSLAAQLAVQIRDDDLLLALQVRQSIRRVDDFDVPALCLKPEVHVVGHYRPARASTLRDDRGDDSVITDFGIEPFAIPLHFRLVGYQPEANLGRDFRGAPLVQPPNRVFRPFPQLRSIAAMFLVVQLAHYCGAHRDRDLGGAAGQERPVQLV